MELDYLFSDTKWKILTELSKESKSPMELSTIFNTSIANMSQQLRFLEAVGVISKTKIKSSKKGKPRTKYFITNELIYLVRLNKDTAIKQQIKPDNFNTFTINVISNIQKKDQFYLMKFFWNNVEILSNASIGLFKNSIEKMELFIISENLEIARKTLSKQEIINLNNEKKEIICWTHNLLETENGTKANDPHFINLIKKSDIVYDPLYTLQKIKEGINK